MKLPDNEIRDITKLLEEGKPLPDKYRFMLFGDNREIELVWNGKTSDVTNIVLPFQTIEHVDEPRSEKDINCQPELFDFSTGRQLKGWTNKLIWGDNKFILSSLKYGPLREKIENEGGIKLIYIDPPFDVGADFTMNIEIGEETLEKDRNVLEEIAYRDTWGKGQDSLLSMLRERVDIAKNLLSSDGFFIFHCDWRFSSRARIMLDEIFDNANFVNEVIWQRRQGKTSPDTNRLENVVDYLLIYRKTSYAQLNILYTKHGAEKYIEQSFKHTDSNGRKYQSTALNAPVRRPTLIYDFMGYKPPKNGWSVTKDVMQKMYEEGRLLFPKSKEGRIRRKQYLDEWKGYTVNSLWNDINVIASQSAERVGYPTQKPELLLQRIIEMASNPGDIICDFFVGSGTAAAVAEKLGRKWICADLGKFAIHTTRKRMIGIQRQLKKEGKNYRAFEVLNLGKYESDYFISGMIERSTSLQTQKDRNKEAEFNTLILQAYNAEPVEGFETFKGKKDNRFVAVGPINMPVSRLYAEEVIQECLAKKITKTDLLAFEFEMGLFPNIQEHAAEKGIDLVLKYIPKDVFDKRAVNQGGGVGTVSRCRLHRSQSTL